MVSMVVQHEVEGLEVHIGDGRWVAVPPGAFAIMAGEQLRVATNGRVPACLHRVRTPSSNRERFSVLFASRQKDGVAVSALEDLVDAEHPLLFNPLRHEKYTKWRYSKEGMKLEDPLKMFCGVEKVGAMV
ncbi:putative inactive 2-oxoglutarate-dependent dioxygenase AOP2 [Panicum miliaceum]|uniref:Inactive 2-oxoglutarate-dependent dioxygenase AOP2 n=1 Tax=Panicum miliaceum TaxID=4540 RepID=A0A3L6PQJ4_PANMI|nr:putative inactive 2-oxoglutarate-dependent dioxygenase AOP2 [Panicum miliaceum]